MTQTNIFHQDLLNTPNTGTRDFYLKCNPLLLALLVSMLIAFNVEADSQGGVVKLKSKGCEVTIYQTQLAAVENGEIEEVCFIDGSLSGAFNPTAEKAIKNNAHAACSCGTDKVYVKSRSVPDRDSAHVVMVAFRYVGENDTNSPDIDPYEAIKLNRSGAKVTPASTERDTTGKVFLDDYGRLPSGTAKPRSTTMIWLNEKSAKG